MKKTKRERSVRIFDVEEIARQKPSPADFDQFYPYACAELECTMTPTIIRNIQDEYVTSKASDKAKSGRGKKPALRPSVSKVAQLSGELKPEGNKKSSTLNLMQSSSMSFRDSDCITVTTVYDTQDHLVEIVFNKTAPIPRMMMQVLGLCIPFHPYLTKLTIRRGGLNMYALHEIMKFLPTSALTEICLDDSPIPEANYYVLLNEQTQLKHLSLCRCNINDEACEVLAKRLESTSPAGKSLMLLNLTSNLITDRGAEFIGDALRTNRSLRYLNLSGNRITDLGCFALLNILMEFSLSYEEIIEKRHRRLTYARDRANTYNQCLEDLINAPTARSIDEYSRASKRKSVKNKKTTSATSLKKPRKLLDKDSSTKSFTNFGIGTNTLDSAAYARAEMLTNELLGPFDDPYSYEETLCKYGYVHCVGNMALNYLNLAYNNIEYPSILKILEMFSYQCEVVKKGNQTGLMKIVIEGNYLPGTCPEMETVDEFMERSMLDKQIKQILPKKKGKTPK